MSMVTPHTLTITLADAADLAWAQRTVTAAHYLHAPVDPRARPTLGDMLPCPAVFDCIHITIGDSVIVSDCPEHLTGFAALSDFYHLSSCEFGESVIFAKRATCYCSAFYCSIDIIVFRSTKPQMVWVDAGWHVALMTDEHTFGDWSFVNRVAESMGHDVAPILRNRTVSVPILSAGPQPAFIVTTLVYVAPKFIEQGALAGIESTVTNDVLDRLTLDPAKQLTVAVCDGRLLPAATHAQSAWIGILDLQVLGFVVAWEEPGGVSLAVSLSEICAILDRGNLSATALALAVGIPQTMLGYPRGELFKVCREVGGGDMISHVIRSFQRLTKPWDVDASPGHLFWLQGYSTTFPKFHQLFVMLLFSPMYTDRTGAPIPGPSGKYGWAWRLPAPQWSWQDLTDIAPRTMRLF